MAGYGNLRLNSLLGESGPAPGNSFPDLDYSGGYTPREFNQMQDQQRQVGFDNQLRLANIANRMKKPGQNGQPGNADGSPNVVYDMRPELAEKDRKERQAQFQEESRLKEKSLDTSATLHREDARDVGKQNMYQNAIAQQNADTTRMNVTRPDIDWMDLNGNMVGVDKRTGRRVSDLGPSGRMTDEAKLKATQDNQAANQYSDYVYNTFLQDRAHQNAKDVAGIRGNIAMTPSPSERATTVNNRAAMYANDPTYSRYFTRDGANYSLNTTYNDPTSRMLFQELYGQEPGQPLGQQMPQRPQQQPFSLDAGPMPPQQPMSRVPAIRSHQNTQPALGSMGRK